jgi:hypothetical protein
MADYIYMSNPAKIKSLLDKIQIVGVPDKLTIKSLESMGFKSTNDRPLLSIMKELGFISSSGQPEKRWLDYRNKSIAPKVLAEAIKNHYESLFQLYPDAHLKDNEALRNFFSTHTKVSSNTLDFIVRTFKAVSEIADFNDLESIKSSASSNDNGSPIVQSDPKIQISKSQRSGMTININVQLTLPEGADSDTFDAFFKAMNKHLLS